MTAPDEEESQRRPGTVRRAEERDRAAIRDAHRDLAQAHVRRHPHIFNSARADDFSERGFTTGLAADDVLMLVVERDGEIIATAKADLLEQPGDGAFKARRRVYVTHLITAPDARRQGHGRALMQAVKDWARLHEADCVELCVWDGSDEAMAFYRALGYRPVYTQLTLTVSGPNDEQDK